MSYEGMRDHDRFRKLSRRSKSIGLLLAAVMVLAGAPMGRAHAETGEPAQAPGTSADQLRFKQVEYPNTRYKKLTCAISLSAIDDHTLLDVVEDCAMTVTFNTVLEKLTVPVSWPRWGFPPFTETPKPEVLSVFPETSLVITFSRRTDVTGFELGFVTGEQRDVQATFRDRRGQTIGNTLLVSAGTRARLVAAIASGTRQIEISSPDPFAIAQLRVQPTARSGRAGG